MRRLLLLFFGLILFLFSLLVNPCFASNRDFILRFDPSELTFETAEGYDLVKMVGARYTGELGTPLLPARFVQIAVPNDVEVEKIKVVSYQRQELRGTYNLFPVQPCYPVSSLPTKVKEVEFVEPDPSVYAHSVEYPGELVRVTNNGFLGGQHIAGVALYPLQYLPSQGKLFLYTEIEFIVILKPSSQSPVSVNRRSQSTTAFYSELAKSSVINPEAVRREGRGLGSKDGEVDFLIITDGDFIFAIQELADWKIKKGISTEIKDITWVLSNYTGSDDPDKVRNCISDYYSNHGTKWIVLGGDTDVLPYRLTWVVAGDYQEYIPCDLYYSDLDGDWDANGNGLYGEVEDSVDMYPEVFVGRAPCNNSLQAQMFVNKCLSYETNPDTDYLTSMLFTAEEMWPRTDAAILKNHIDSAFVPDYFQITKLYETSNNLTKETFQQGLNAGQNIVNHCGHGCPTGFSIGLHDWWYYDMDSLVNAPRYSLFYSLGCLTAAIDEDCIAEHFVNNTHGGGFAYCGNTRYGWGVHYEPLQGPGSELDAEFFSHLFDGGDYQLGNTLGNSKIPFIPLVQEGGSMSAYYRWSLYTLLLLGDPTLEMWTDTPQELNVSHNPVFPTGTSYMEVAVAQDSALVCCVKEGQILGTAYSVGGRATVFFDSPLETTGIMQVTVTKHDHMSLRDSVLVIPPGGPYIVYHSHLTDDSQGNDNDVVNPDEIISLSVILKNVGIEDALDITAILREDDPYVTVIDSISSFGDIDSEMTAQSIEDYMFAVDASCPDSHTVEFILTASDVDTSWTTVIFLMVVEPGFSITAIPDTIVIGQGDSSVTQLALTSFGGFIWPVDLTHSTLPSQLTARFEPEQVVPPDSATLIISAAPSTPPQTLIATITASGSGIAHDVHVTVGVPSSPYHGPVRHVSVNGSDLIGNGSEDYPFRTVQKGIDSSSDGDTVLVESGRYVENINFRGKGIVLTSRYVFDGQWSTIESTIIDGNYWGSVVTFDSGEDSNSVIRGFTITQGYARHGAGIRCYESSPNILDNYIVRDSCQWYGCGGVGIFCQNSRARIYRNVIALNSGPAAVSSYSGSDIELINNILYINPGGGLGVQYAAVHARNNIFFCNGPYGVHVTRADCYISYSDVIGHDENYHGIPDQTGINGNISANPLFVSLSEADFRLLPASPCIDSGDPADSIPPGGGGRIDMGAFEYQVEGPWVMYLSHQIDDSWGNGNGAINPDELIHIPIMMLNNGTQSALGVSAALRAESEYVTICDSVQGFGDLEPLSVAGSWEDYVVAVRQDCPDSHQVVFTLEATDGQTSWLSTFQEMVIQEDFTFTAIPETARVVQGSSTSIKFILEPLGGFVSDVNLSHATLPSNVTAQFEPEQVMPPDSSVLTFWTAATTPTGDHWIKVMALGGGIMHAKYVLLEIRRPGCILQVSTAGNDTTGDGSEDYPFRTIQKAILESQDGDTVLVQKGRYEGYTVFCGRCILLTSSYIFDHSESTIESTVIDAAGFLSSVYFIYGEDSTSIIRGFTITGGSSDQGGGICCRSSSPIICDNFVVENAATQGGSGIYCGSGSNARIRRNLIARCSGPAAVSLHAYFDGEMINNTVCDNDWGGLYVQFNSGGCVKNNIVYNNAPYGIQVSSSWPEILYNNVYGHDENYMGISDQTDINGNISDDPFFVNQSAGDYHLADESPCIDAGDPSTPPPPGGGSRIDMGAFEHPIDLIVGDASGNGEINAEDVIWLLNYLFMGGPAPWVMEAGDANGDGDVNAADIMYLINYLFRGGPPPGKADSHAGDMLAREESSGAPVLLWISNKSTTETESNKKVFVQASSEVNIAAVQLAIAYDPEKLSLIPVLPSNLLPLKVFSSQKDGMLKVGILDLKGENWIPSGNPVDLLVLQVKGEDLSSLVIKQAILVDREALILLVKILSEEQSQQTRPQTFSLSQNYPNPFNPQTQICYSLPVACHVKITIYNLLGQQVRVLVNRNQVAGYKRVIWDGKNQHGIEVGSGIYFYEIRAADFKQTRKMLLLK